MHKSVAACVEAIDGIDSQSTQRPLEQPLMRVPQSMEDEVLLSEQR